MFVFQAATATKNAWEIVAAYLFENYPPKAVAYEDDGTRTLQRAPPKLAFLE